LFFLINISLVMHLLPIEGRILVGDRYTYLSFVGLFLLIALAADYFIEKKKAVIVIAVLVAMLAAMAANTWRDKSLWQNSFTLWQKALEVNRENHYAMFSLALAHMAEGGDAGEAVKFLTMAIERKPDYLYYNNRGRVHYANQNYPDALADFEMAIALDSSSYASYNNRGAVLQQYCNFSQALADYEKAVELQSDYQEAINNKQKILTLMHFDSIVMLQSMPPGTDTTRLSAFIVSMSDKMLNTNQRARAIDYLNRGILLVASDASLYQALALAYHRNHEFSKANMVYNKGLNALPENPILLLGRGLLYIQTGDTLSACSDFKSAAMQGDNDSQQMLDMFCRYKE
ncbi:MAG TPA: tetratricopeptide repeat protein, partial [Bacteroidales bacterium]|nr:tetratricopeptide repeat protein [Bacteroidales bacterium]